MKAFMQKLGVLSATLSIFLSASAYDFKVDGIYYNITDPAAKEIEVTYESESYGSYSGDIVVPSSVTYNGADYKVTALGKSSFAYCSNLTSIEIPNTVTSIGNHTFYDCHSLTSIEIPNSVTSIGEAIFYKCSGLTSMEIPNTVTTMGKYTFTECSSLTTVSLPNTVTTIGYGTFTKCSSLTTIEIPNTVTTIGDYAFAGCTGLTTIALPNAVTTIGARSFSGCTGLTSIAIPGTVTKIGDYAFYLCDSMTKIEVADENQAYSSKDGILYNKSQETLVRCPGGKAGEIIIPNTVTTIGTAAFSWSVDLTSIVIPTSVTAIGEKTFVNCNSLTTIVIPNSVTTIGKEAFSWCSGLRSITSLAGTPPECGDSVFDNIDKQKCTLYVPAGSVEAYKQAPKWEDFNIVAEAGTGIDSIEAGDAVGTTEVFNLAGEKVADTPESLSAGIYIVRDGLTARKIVVR